MLISIFLDWRRESQLMRNRDLKKKTLHESFDSEMNKRIITTMLTRVWEPDRTGAGWFSPRRSRVSRRQPGFVPVGGVSLAGGKRIVIDVRRPARASLLALRGVHCFTRRGWRLSEQLSSLTLGHLHHLLACSLGDFSYQLYLVTEGLVIFVQRTPRDVVNKICNTGKKKFST